MGLVHQWDPAPFMGCRRSWGEQAPSTASQQSSTAAKFALPGSEVSQPVLPPQQPEAVVGH